MWKPVLPHPPHGNPPGSSIAPVHHAAYPRLREEPEGAGPAPCATGIAPGRAAAHHRTWTAQYGTVPHQVSAQAEGPYLLAARIEIQISSPEKGPLIV